MPVLGSVRGYGWGRSPILRPNIGFIIQPAYRGRTFWNLYDDGDFIYIPDPANPRTHTITFTANVEVGIIGIGAGGGNHLSFGSSVPGSGGGAFAGHFSANTTTSYKIFAGLPGNPTGGWLPISASAAGGAATGLLTRSDSPLAIAGGGGGAGGRPPDYNFASPGYSTVGIGWNPSFFVTTANITTGANSTQVGSQSPAGGVSGIASGAFSGGWGGLDGTEWHNGAPGAGGGGWEGGASSRGSIDHDSIGGGPGLTKSIFSTIEVFQGLRSPLPPQLPYELVGHRQNWPNFGTSGNTAPVIRYGAAGTSGALMLYWKRFDSTNIDASGGVERIISLNDKVLVKEHVFTASGTFTVNTTNINSPVEFILVGGGGGGGNGGTGVGEGGGGGDGGQVEYGFFYAQPGATTITIGAGGLGAAAGTGTTDGTDSTIELPNNVVYTAKGGVGGSINVNRRTGYTGRRFPVTDGLFADNTTDYGGGGAQSDEVTLRPTWQTGRLEEQAQTTRFFFPGNSSGGVTNVRGPNDTSDGPKINGKPNTGGGGAGGWGWFTTYNRYVNVPGNGAAGIVILRYAIEQTGLPSERFVPARIRRGLRHIQFSGGYFNDNAAWFSSPVAGNNFYTNRAADGAPVVSDDIEDSFPGRDLPEFYCGMIVGYFCPQVTDTYTFTITSDDGSFMWIGNEARDIENTGTSAAFIDNGGTHGPVAAENRIYLTAGIFYPITVVYGNRGGPGYFGFGWRRDGNPFQSSDFSSVGFVNTDTRAF